MITAMTSARIDSAKDLSSIVDMTRDLRTMICFNPEQVRQLGTIQALADKLVNDLMADWEVQSE